LLIELLTYLRASPLTVKIFREIFQVTVKNFVVGRTKKCSVFWGDRFVCVLIGFEEDKT